MKPKRGGTVGILNVGAGDIKLTFDKTNPAEVIRSSRIVADMLRRGFALLVEVDDGKGGKVFTRAKKFNAETAEYIIADFDPTVAVEEDKEGHAQAEAKAADTTVETISPPEAPKRRGRPPTRERAIPADSTRAIAVSRSAGG